MYLIDTNIFLEILLDQDKKIVCQDFISNHSENIFISDFSFHSIAIILFRYKKLNILREFYSDVISQIQIVTLPASQYEILIERATQLELDFDDLYQYSIAKHFNLSIVTMDADFKKVSDLNILLL